MDRRAPTKKTFTQDEVNEIKNDLKFSNEIKNIGDAVVRIETKMTAMANEYVTKLEFGPVKAITYGMVGTLLMGVLGAILTLVFRK